MKHKLRLVFTKLGPVRFISHLDLARLFQRAVFRAQIPVLLSQGFTPRPRISFKRALKLGLESQDEEVVFQFESKPDPLEVRRSLQEQLPEGINIKEINFV